MVYSFSGGGNRTTQRKPPPVASHWQTLSHNVVSSTPKEICLVLLAEETGVLGENLRPVSSHWQTLSHNVVSSTPRLNGIHNVSVISWRSVLLVVFQLYLGSQFYWWRKPEYLEKTTTVASHWQTLSHNVVSSTLHSVVSWRSVLLVKETGENHWPITFNNISVTSWGQLYWWRKPEDTEKTTDLS